MGVAKAAAKHTVNKVTNKAIDNMGVVGDVIDKHTTTGQLDAADDALKKTQKDLDKQVKKAKKDIDKKTKKAKKDIAKTTKKTKKDIDKKTKKKR